MAQVLRNKNQATRFQILVEIAANQPYIQQKDIAGRIGVTSQAVSDYVSKMEKDGWIQSDGRAHFRITKEGVNWLLRSLRELQQYSSTAERALVNITTWAAIADSNLKSGQEVNLVMKNGMLFAVLYSGKGARGVTTCAAKRGEDVGVNNIEDIVMLELGEVVVVEIPGIADGGSRCADPAKLKRWLVKADVVGAVGPEAVVALQKLDIEPHYLYGVAPAAIEAARSGLTAVVICSASESALILQRIKDEGIPYRVVVGKKKKG